MKYSSENVWGNFIEGFQGVINKTKHKELKKICFNKTDRTKFYRDILLKSICNCMSLKYANKEFLRVDFVFYHKSSKGSWQIPVVFIESENEYNDKVIETELPKLCCLNAPLKVLFIWTRWDEESLKRIHYEDFKYFIDSHKEAVALTGYLAVIVGDYRDGELRYDYFVYKENDTDITKYENIVRITI